MHVLCSEKQAEKRERERDKESNRERNRQRDKESNRERKRQREIGKLNEKACPGETAINCILLYLGLQTKVII